MDPEEILPPQSPDQQPERPVPPVPEEPLKKTATSVAVPSPRQSGERTFTIIKRHPVGMFGIYVMCGLVLFVTAALAFGVAPSMASDNSREIMLAGVLVFAVVLGICTAVALVSAKI